MLNNVAYQVLAVYDCNICKKSHQSNLGIPNLLPDPGARMAEMADVKIRVYNSVKAVFENEHTPTDKFNPKKLTITEIDEKGKSKKIKISEIEELLKGEMSEIEKIEAQKRSGDETAEKIAKAEGKILETPEKDLEEIPLSKEGMSFDEIRERVKIRVAELQKASKDSQEAAKKLGIQLKEFKTEIVSLQSLLKAANQLKEKKKNGRTKRKRAIKQSPKS